MGEEDDGGPARQRALQDAATFARGEGVTVDGLTLAEVAGAPIDSETQVMLLSSAVGLVGLSSIAAEPEAFNALKALTLYEVPIHTEGLTRYVGMMPWDQDERADSSRSGCVWDDGQNPWITDGACRKGRCTLPKRRLAWSDTASVSDLTVYVAQEHDEATPGMLFIDGDGDGELTLSSDGHPDRDGDGHIHRSEDIPLPGMPDDLADSERYWLSLSVMEEALLTGVLDEDHWPDHLHPPDETRAYWGERDGYGSLAPIHAALPDLRWLVSATERDHGIPSCGRPHLVDLYEQLRSIGADVQFNPGAAAFEDAGIDTTDYTPLLPGAALTESTVQEYTPPLSVDSHYARTASMLDMIDALR